MVKTRTFSMRMDEELYQLLSRRSKEMGLSMAEVLSRAFFAVNVYFSPYLRAEDAIKTVPVNPDEEVALADVLKSPRELYDVILKRMGESERRKRKK